MVFHQILVPASKTLRLRELQQLGTYEESQLEVWDPTTAHEPHELSELTRSAAQAKAIAEMEGRHRTHIARSAKATAVKTSCLPHGLSGRPVLVPVYIGVYPYRGRPWRILVNGQSGKLVGEAPTSIWKVLGVIGLVLFAVAALALGLAVCIGTPVLGSWLT